jgi:hypothetical protein
MGYYQKKRKIKIGWIILGGLVLGGGYYLYTKVAPYFETKPPTIQLEGSSRYTNLKKPLKIKIKDESGIRYYSVIAIADGEVFTLDEGSNLGGAKEVDLNLTLPKVVGKELIIKVKAVDNSKWNFFSGNEIKKEYRFQVDALPPSAVPVANSYAIGRGGSGLVVVKVTDDHLKDKYILVDGKYKFKLTPFIKPGYYIAILAWPLQEERFSADIIATDEAGNRVKSHIPFFWRKYRYRNKKINIPPSFIQNVAIPILEKSGLEIPNDPISIFKKMNEEVRKLNETEIRKLTSPVREEKFSTFWIRWFNPLPGSKREAGFGDYRHYYYDGKEISKAYHKGMDLAKVIHSKIHLSNPGVVVATKWIGIYGNVTIVYHQLGVYTLYAHMSQFNTHPGEQVQRGAILGRTGRTGGVLGDHLHFGVYVQGVAVNPLEWMDPHFLKNSFYRVIQKAKKVILDEGKTD